MTTAAHKNQWHGRVALVIGASSTDIGAGICAVLVRTGVRVIGCDRSKEKIELLAQKLKEEGAVGQLFAKCCDLTQETQIIDLFEQIKEEFVGVDILINNAGLRYDASLLTGSTEQWDNMWQVNVRVPCICAREFFKNLKERNVNDGHVIYIGSISSHQLTGDVQTQFYNATKFALRTLAEGHSREARAQIIQENEIGRNRVTFISPAFEQSEFEERITNLQNTKRLYRTSQTKELKDVADAVIYALSAPPHVDVNDIIIRRNKKLK